jgi:hypothetical protein
MTRQTLRLAALLIAGLSLTFTAAARDVGAIGIVIAPIESGADECVRWAEIIDDCVDK